jgi:membrane protein
MRVDRERILKELTFWLRPGFLLRCAQRFSAVEGIDRSIALASSAFTAIIPLSVLLGAVLPRVGEEDTAERLIDNLDLSGAGAEAVRQAFAPAEGTETSIGIMGALLLVITVLAFSRAVQRLVERTWELPALSVRNTRGGLEWIAGMVLFVALGGALTALFDGPVFALVGTAVALAEGVVFLIWSGWVLSAKRVVWRRLLPFALLAAAGLGTYGVVSDLWLPQLFNTYTERYGVIGATFALISWLFGAMVILVVASAIGREVSDELERIRAGERESQDAVLAEWDGARQQAEQVRDETRVRWDAWRRRRAAKRAGDGPGADGP